MEEIKAKSTDAAQWKVLVDAAAYVPTQPLDLSEVPADFVVMSFYKMFGYPTGLGALLVRVEAAELLQKVFEGGGDWGGGRRGEGGRRGVGGEGAGAAEGGEEGELLQKIGKGKGAGWGGAAGADGSSKAIAKGVERGGGWARGMAGIWLERGRVELLQRWVRARGLSEGVWGGWKQGS